MAKKMSSTTERAKTAAAHREAQKAADEQATVASELRARLAEATAAMDAAERAANDADDPTDPRVKAWSECRSAMEWINRKAKKAEAEAARLQTIADEARAAAQRVVDAEHLDDLRAKISASAGSLVTKHAAALLGLERAFADAVRAMASEIEEDVALRAEASKLAAALGVDLVLEAPITRARVLAAVACTDARPDPMFVLPRAPSPMHERVHFLCEQLGESMLTGDRVREVWPVEDQIAALLDGTYREKKRSIAEQLKADEEKQRAATKARQEQLDREQWQKDQERVHRYAT